PDQPMIFAVAAAGGERVPRRVDVAGAVGRDRAATVDAVAAPRQVSLRLERGPIGVRPRIEKGRARLAVRRVHEAAWACRVRAVPCDVDTTAPADRELAPADRPRRDRAAGLAVDADWIRKCRSAIGRANVKEIAGPGLAGEIKNVNHAACVDDGLRLDAVV